MTTFEKNVKCKEKIENHPWSYHPEKITAKLLMYIFPVLPLHVQMFYLYRSWNYIFMYRLLFLLFFPTWGVRLPEWDFEFDSLYYYYFK